MDDKHQPPTQSIHSHPRTILLVDDNDALRLTTKWFLGGFGYTVDSARTAEDALALFNPSVHDLVVTDNSMAGMSGVEMAHVIKLRSPSTPVVMCTGALPEDRSCVDVLIQKPVPLLTLKETLDRTLGMSPAGTMTNRPA